MNDQKQWPTFKAGDEVFNIRMRDWGMLSESHSTQFPLMSKDNNYYAINGMYALGDNYPTLLAYNPFDPFDPKNRDMPDWMQEYVNGKNKPNDLDEIKRKIYAREMAIENDDKEALRKCCKEIWPECYKPYGKGQFYYQDSDYTNKWFADPINPYESSILATELLRLIENITMPESPITPSHYKQPDPFEIAEIYGVNPPIADAVKYILRAGSKDASKYIEDLQKAIKCIQREIELSNKYRGGNK